MTTNGASGPRILVIGAGPSGIACATKLLEHGFENLMVLEAEPRIGGRIHTIPFADNVIDLGAQWCHGEKNNVVYDLAQKHSLLESTGDVYDNYRCIRSNGEIVPESIAQRLKDIVNNSLVTRQKELRGYKGSLGEYLTQKFYGELAKAENADITLKLAREFFENYKKFENSVEASNDLDEVSGCGYLEYKECEGDLLLNWKDKGFLEFLRLLLHSHELGTEHGVLERRIRLSKKVKRIYWQRMDTKVLVKCTDGDEIMADHVILTVSLGVLQTQLRDLFEPTLPDEKQRVIRGLNFGTVNKIFMEFPEKFWPNDWTGFTFLWRDEDVHEIRGTERSWLEDVFGFYCVSYQPRILCGWIIGESARHMEKLSKQDVLAGCLWLFRKFLPWPVPMPINFITSAWFTNPNFRGSYSFRSMHTDEVRVTARQLAQPITLGENVSKINGNHNGADCENSSPSPSPSPSRSPSRSPIGNCDKPILQFAGEASSEHYYSTVHGAVEAGWREANRLAKFYRNDNDENNVDDNVDIDGDEDDEGEAEDENEEDARELSKSKL